MRLIDIIKVTIALRILRKESEEWEQAYKQYIHCLGLIVMMGIFRYLLDAIVLMFILVIAYIVFSSLKVNAKYNPAIVPRSLDLYDGGLWFREKVE